MEYLFYDDSSYNSVKPESEIEDAVLRRAILPDAIDLLPGEISKMEAVHRRIAVTGGRFVMDARWCPDLAIHYQLCEQATDGWYRLQVVFWHRKTAMDLGGFTLWTALQRFPPLVQASWLGYPRSVHCHPVWRLPPKVDFRESSSVPLIAELPTPEQLFLLAVNSVPKYEPFEWNPVVPHLRLIDLTQLLRSLK